MRQQEGGAVDPSIFETQEANAAILQNLATRRALQAQMAHHYMNVSEADAINVIKNADAFKKDGQSLLSCMKTILPLAVRVTSSSFMN